MTIQAPLHVLRGGFPHERHLIYATVAGNTGYPTLDVDGVVEIDKIREIIYAIPLQRHLPGEALAYGSKHGSIDPDLGMAGHASFGRRHASKRLRFYGSVAVPAINA